MLKMKTSWGRGLVVLIMLMSFALSAQAQKRYRVGYKDEGFSAILELSGLFPSNTYAFSFSGQAVFGLNLGPNLFVGAGTGIDAYESDLYVPVFADARYFFIADKFSPFAVMDVGYGIPVDADETLGAGLMVHPGFGARFFLTNTVAFNGSLGYRFQSMPLTTNDNPNWIQSFVVRIGMSF